jgi:hypothetical protein
MGNPMQGGALYYLKEILWTLEPIKTPLEIV